MGIPMGGDRSHETSHQKCFVLWAVPSGSGRRPIRFGKTSHEVHGTFPKGLVFRYLIRYLGRYVAFHDTTPRCTICCCCCRVVAVWAE